MESVVVVTGAAGRLGSRMAARFRANGYPVVAIGKGQDFEADLTIGQNVQRIFDAIGRRHGRIFALVHTVGTWRAQPLADTTPKDWEQMMKTNLTSTFLCFRAALRLMTAGDGRLIAITSAQGADGARAEQAAYAASKAGVMRLVEAAADEYRAHGISAHALAPSVITYGEEDGAGVPAKDLVDAALFLCSAAGKSSSGATLRLYG